MKKLKFVLSGLVLASVLTFSFIAANFPAEESDRVAGVQDTNDQIQWVGWDEAVKMADKNPKKIFIDCYTNWCGWCKRMDQTTFKDPEVVKYMNDNFYAVKFNAERKDTIVWRGHTFNYIPSGRRGVHQLAYSLLDGRLGYPSFVYLDENFDRITISPGYKTSEVLMKELEYVSGGHYKNTSFQEFKDR